MQPAHDAISVNHKFIETSDSAESGSSWQHMHDLVMWLWGLKAASLAKSPLAVCLHVAHQPARSPPLPKETHPVMRGPRASAYPVSV